MKKITFTILSIFIALSSFSQYYYILESSPGQNPGGLNTDNVYPVGGGLDVSWTTILNSASTPAWSPNQSIPFTFDFNGAAVTDYKVSSSGVLTFTTSASTVPSFTNASLPDASIPNSSVCVWGIQGTGSNDAIATKTFGTAPNRQHWVLFASYTVGTSTWTYWSIVLEETSNNIYIVDERHGGTVSGLTLGIQIDGTTATSVTGSPNVSALAGSDASPADNAYYQFIHGTQPAYDMKVTQTDLDLFVTLSANNSVVGNITNIGSTTITSFDIVYTVDGNAPVSSTISSVNITPNSTYQFTHPTPFVPSTGGHVYNLCIYANNLNGTNNDDNPINDTLCVNPICITNTSGTKHVLIEEFTTAACGYCPDGHIILDEILTNNPNVIGVCHHAGFGTDNMTIPAHSSYAAVMASGAPTAAIDRGENLGLSRNIWESTAISQLSKWTPCDVGITASYDAGTRAVSADVSVDFVDYAAGDLRITLFIVENQVTGSGAGYDQTNYYNTTSGHPMYGLGNPIIGYEHNHVVREVLPSSDIWGLSGSIMAHPQPSDNVTYTFNTTLDASWNADHVKLVAFVSYYNSNTTKRDILNAFEINLTPVSIEGNIDYAKLSELYPNPTNNNAFINIDLQKESNVIINVKNLLGKVVYSYNNSLYGQNKIMLETNNLSSGIYLVEINIDNKRTTKKLILSK